MSSRNGHVPPEPPAWPDLSPVALHGLAGEIVRTISPSSEADPAHLLVQLLAGFGAALGRGPHAQAGDAEHPARLFVVIVGSTSKARKGTSWATLSRVFRQADPRFFPDRVRGGWGSGEAIIDEVRDAGAGTDSGAPDTRLLIQEGEFARFLRVASRDGSTLSATARLAWDGEPLQVRSRTASAVAKDHHIGVVGHITLEELRSQLSQLEVANGFGNRFLYVLGRRSKLLPEGGNLDDRAVYHMAGKVAETLEVARSRGRLHRDAGGGARWNELYFQMAEDEPGGIFGAVTSRDEAQCLRLSVTYALLDRAKHIGVEHVEAAWAVWQYCRQSAAYIFGDNLGDEKADRLYGALRAAGEAGMTIQQQRALFGNHIPSERLASIRALLQERGLTREVQEQTGGRPRTITRALVAESARKAQKARKGAVR
jgi:hypothetical protein